MMPLDIQWFIFALISNGAITRADADRFYAQLGPNPSLGEYAQLVLNQLAAGLSEEDAQSVLTQLQTVIDYATAQAETGFGPEIAAEPASANPAATGVGYSNPGAADEEDEENAPRRSKRRTGLVKDSSVRFNNIEIDLTAIRSYADLPSLRNVSSMSDAEVEQLMITLLTCLRALGCSDLHLSAGAPPFVRRMLEVERFDDVPLPEEDARRLNTVLLSPERLARFNETMDLSFALEIGQDRFRVCLMMHKDGVAGSYRLVPDHICSLEELGFMDHDVVHIKRLLDYSNGLVLVTGPIGSGKTTTLAAMVDIVNNKRTDHIITVEDPIEILQLSKNCQVTQREIGKHTISYRTALKAALREDPDVIVIGELHDLETIENAITASETGHLVIGTLHTSDAANTLNRLLDVFPPSQQPQIRAMTAGSLRGIICQRLIPAADGGLTTGYEILINNMAVGNIISEGKSFKLKATMQIGNKQGMCTLEQCLLEKYMRNLITYEVALANMRDQSVISQLQREWATREARKLKK